MNVYVFFTTSHRRPKRFSKVWIITKMVHLLGRSEWCHVSFGNTIFTISPTIAGDVLHDTRMYIDRRAEVKWMVSIETDHEFVKILNQMDMRSVSPWPTFFRWITGLPIPARDCVQRTKKFLRSAGVCVPSKVTTINQLWDWLRSDGHTFIDITGETSCQAIPPNSATLT